MDTYCVGNSTLDILEIVIEGKELLQAYSGVLNYYVRTSDYVSANFPLEHEVLKHAEIGHISKRTSAIPSSVRFVIKKNSYC